MCAMNVGIVMANLAALRAAVLRYLEKPQGGGADIRPPSVRGLKSFNCVFPSLPLD